MNGEWVVEGLEVQLDGFHLGPVDLTLTPGHALAVLGTTGAGKTTLLRTLAGFLRARRGRILRAGVDIAEWLPEERGLGYVPQGLGLLPHRTVAGNIGYPMEVRGRGDVRTRTRELIERFRLESLADRYPTRLSGGEQQRVAIARAIAADPGLIVWDEPWQGLDVLARHELGAVLHEIRETERIPIVVVTHDPGLAFSIADSFVVLRAGRVREQCDAVTLMNAPADPFVARFVGFENVFEPEDLTSGRAGSLRAWLSERGGREGVAFATPMLPAEPIDSPAWEGTVRSVRPTPQGVTIEATSDELMLALRMPPPVSRPVPTRGERVAFRIDPVSIRPLGPTALAAGAI